MKKIPIIDATSRRHGSRAEFAGRGYCLSRPLPVFYMSDYSVPGLLVENIEKARDLLGSHEYPVSEEPYGLDVEISGPAQLPEIIHLLAAHSIRCEMTDAIDQIYQG